MVGNTLKAAALLALTHKRKATRLKGYQCVGDFQNGRFECDHVSPWTKSGRNLDATIMIIGQDWVSADVLASYAPDSPVAERGFDAAFPTNANLDRLLRDHFGLERGQCYLTNLFAFIKPDNASTSIPIRDLISSARDFTLEEIRIIAPQLVICLGLRTFQALARAASKKKPRNIEQAINSPFSYVNSMVHCVAHTGAFGMNNRGRAQVDKDWASLAWVQTH